MSFNLFRQWRPLLSPAPSRHISKTNPRINSRPIPSFGGASQLQSDLPRELILCQKISEGPNDRHNRPTIRQWASSQETFSPKERQEAHCSTIAIQNEEEVQREKKTGPPGRCSGVQQSIVERGIGDSHYANVFLTAATAAYSRPMTHISPTAATAVANSPAE